MSMLNSLGQALVWGQQEQYCQGTMQQQVQMQNAYGLGGYTGVTAITVAPSLMDFMNGSLAVPQAYRDPPTSNRAWLDNRVNELRVTL